VQGVQVARAEEEKITLFSRACPSTLPKPACQPSTGSPVVMMRTRIDRVVSAKYGVASSDDADTHRPGGLAWRLTHSCLPDIQQV